MILLLLGICVLNEFIFEDELLLYTVMILALTLIFVIDMKPRTRIWNFAIFTGYNAPLLYCLFYKGDYGTSLYWWIFLLLFNVVHILALIFFSLINRLKK